MNALLRRSVSASLLPRRLLSTAVSPIVSSWNEWDPLEEVIVGLAGGSAVPPLHPAEEAKVFHMPNTLAACGARSEAKIAAAAAELDGFASILESHGVVVRRPSAEENVGFATPYFETSHMNGWTCPRDVITVVGPEVIEAPTPWRSRNFEIMAYRSLLSEYFARDPAMLWTAAPFPALRDELFRQGYAATAGERAAQVARREFVTHDWVEPTFDAADIIRCVTPGPPRAPPCHRRATAHTTGLSPPARRCGRDVFVLHGHTANLAGFRWIEHQLARRGVRAHLLHMPSVLNPSHIDASIMPLRPGLLLAAPSVVGDLAVFADNGWEVPAPCYLSPVTLLPCYLAPCHLGGYPPSLL